MESAENKLKKLSFVVVGRNDNYGGNLISRTKTFVKVLSHLANIYRVSSEIIFVDYNPVPNKKYLFQEISVQTTPYLSMRGIVVPKEFHEKIKRNNIPLLEYVAKNIGVRRAHGEYIIATNPDIIMSSGLIEYFSRNKIDPYKFYRVDRNDISTSIFPEEMLPKEILEGCRKDIVKIFHNTRTSYVSYREWLNRFIHGRTLKDLSFSPLFNSFYPLQREKIHENAAGDFLMAHHDAWEKARGYSQEPHNLYHDSLILYVLEAFGYEQEVLPYPIYHINHDIGRAGRPGVEFTIFREMTTKMQETSIPLITNDENWGFANEKFEEIQLP